MIGTIRIVSIAALVALGLYCRVVADKQKSIALLTGWFAAVLKIWFLTFRAPPVAANLYLHTAIETDDLEELTCLVHCIKGTVMTFGDALTVSLALKLERTSSEDQTDRLQSAIDIKERLIQISNSSV